MWQTIQSAVSRKSCEGSTERLLQLCGGYFSLYIFTGVLAKYFVGESSYVKMSDIQYTVYNTWGGSLICLVVVLLLGWYKLKSTHCAKLFGCAVPAEYLYIIPSGICTAVVIPTTTLMYLLPISVMVAMVIMRASIIIVSRLVDTVQIRQGLLKKKVYFEENVAMCLAIAAVAVQLGSAKKGDFNLVGNAAAMAILGSYISAYAIRIYIMNYYKNTRPKGAEQDTKGFFAIEQLAASSVMLLVCCWIITLPSAHAAALAGTAAQPRDVLGLFRDSFANPHPKWFLALGAGMFYGVSAFFSVFLFMFKGRTATFAGLVNRLTSLIAGTAATLITWAAFGGKFPKPPDWISLLVMFAAIYYLGLAEKRRTAELAASRELEPCNPAKA
ncbi:MAG: hypothetical protein PHP45_01410 [Elusimicrobiales bacterium]|nr:hypothetical protein [Elusimicrobiales bacterium]